MSETIDIEGVASTLDDAAKIIETEGWHKGTFFGTEYYDVPVTTPVRCCALGAVILAEGRRKNIPTIGKALAIGALDAERAIDRQAVTDYGVGAASFNDNHAGRDKRKVVRLLRRTARNLRNGKLVLS
jgi:hypothetical protein